jgi:hypothetical protein
MVDRIGYYSSISPGRFFAAVEVKAMFAYIITAYDIEVEGGKAIPRDFSIAGLNFPRKVNVMFRARQKRDRSGSG